jgi:hypothetical protein
MFGKPHTYQAKVEPRSQEKSSFHQRYFCRNLANASNCGKLCNMQHLLEILEQDPEITAE